MRKHKGFTLIEVVLVLALAGAIFAMVFLALPGLWRTQRDSDRRNDMLSFINTLKNFQTNNNRGALPTGTSNLNDTNRKQIEVIGQDVWFNKDTIGTDDTTWRGFYRNYLTEEFTDPDGEPYNLFITNCTTANSSLPLSNVCDNPTLTEKDDALYANGANFKSTNHRIFIIIGASCDGEDAVRSANVRKAAILYRLEAVDGIYCGNT